MYTGRYFSRMPTAHLRTVRQIHGLHSGQVGWGGGSSNSEVQLEQFEHVWEEGSGTRTRYTGAEICIEVGLEPYTDGEPGPVLGRGGWGRAWPCVVRMPREHTDRGLKMLPSPLCWREVNIIVYIKICLRSRRRLVSVNTPLHYKNPLRSID